MWMMDSNVAYGTNPENSSKQQNYAPLSESPQLYIIPEEDNETNPGEVMKKILFLYLHPIKAIKELISALKGEEDEQNSDETGQKITDIKEKSSTVFNNLKEKSGEMTAFLQSEETAQKMTDIKEKALSAFDNVNSHKRNPESITASSEYDTGNAKPVVLYAIIGILSLIILIGGILFFRYVKANQTGQGVPVSSISDTPAVPGQNTLVEDAASVPESETMIPVQPMTIQNRSELLSSSTGISKEKIYSDFYQILQNSDAPGGYLYDIDHDGKEDMILKDTYEMNFILYTHNNSGDLYMTRFGYFLAWGDDDFYDVTGNDGTHYIYYSDDYMQRSVQGYFDPQTGNELDLSEGYSESDRIKILSDSGFSVDENSSYNKIAMLYYDDLCQKTAPVETNPPTKSRKPPEISCEIKVTEKEIDNGGYYYRLYISGNYDYYYVECINHGFDGNSDNVITSGNKTEADLYLSSSTRFEYVTASVTPYYSDGTKGKTVTCSASQPEPKVTSVPTPSTCLYMGTGTPVSSDGFLNLRSSKSTSSDSNIITQIPNGAAISMYWIDDASWIYVEYGSYSGYVKESYTKLTDPQGLWADGKGEEEAASTESCYAIGEINGNGVSGFTTSYVVNGGAKTTVRETLGNGWHVTARTRCYAYGITWYELYDTDDGDYYGWVDSNFIRFYGG